MLAAWTLFLFLVWSNSFVAIGYLLGSDAAPARFDWVGLTAARFAPAAVIALAYCFLRRRAQALALVRAHPLRLLVCGLCGVPAYNLALYYGQQHGVPAPVASLTTTLAPLFLLILGAVFLGERLTARRALGFLVALAGMVLIAGAKERGDERPYALLLMITAVAPLSWSIYSAASKPVVARSPVTWTFLAIGAGTLPLFAVLPFRGGPQMLALDAPGWAALLFLSLGCTVLGFAVWTWLLKHLPASTVGFAVFLNPPLTTVSKATLALLLPATFAFTILPREWAGGAVVLGGVAIALAPRATAGRPPPSASAGG